MNRNTPHFIVTWLALCPITIQNLYATSSPEDGHNGETAYLNQRAQLAAPFVWCCMYKDISQNEKKFSRRICKLIKDEQFMQELNDPQAQHIVDLFTRIPKKDRDWYAGIAKKSIQ